MVDSRRARPVPSQPFAGDFWKAGIPAARVHAPPVTVYTLSLLARTRSVTPGLTASSTRIRAFDSDSLLLDTLVGQNVGCAEPVSHPSLFRRHNRGCCHVRTRDVSPFRIPANRTSHLLPSLPQRRGLVPRLPGMLPPTYRNPLILIPPKHFHGRYYTGERVDCGSQRCKTSSAHIHGATTSCRCPAVSTSTVHSTHLRLNP